jgi:hypothetical protein
MKSSKKPTPARLMTIFDCRRLLASVINNHRQGKLTDNMARTQGYLLERLVKIISETETEKRLVELEANIAALMTEREPYR